MHLTSRSYLTAGIAALGVGAIALSPVQPIPNQIALAPQRVVSDLGVELLASSIDPITPWVDTIETALANIGALFDFYATNPGYTSPLGWQDAEGQDIAAFPLLQTLIANQMTYFGWLDNELVPDPLAAITGQIFQNIQTFFNAPWDPGAIDEESGNYTGEYVSNTVLTYGTLLNKPVLPVTQQVAFALLPSILGDSFEQLKPIVDFTATYYSGQAVGLIGPLFAPLIELTRSFTAIGAFFEAGDVTGAINELINIPANITNAVLNGGGYLDLTGVVNAIQPLPEEVESIGINLGGLISPPVPQDGSLVQPDPNDFPPPSNYNGGVAFDSVATKVTALGLKVDDPGIPVSWVGAAVGLGQFLGDSMVAPELPPSPPTTAAAIEAPAPVEAPAVADLPDPVEEAAVADIAEAVAEESAPADLDVAEVDAPAPAKVADEAPADTGSEAKGSDTGDDSGSRASDSRRGGRDAD